MLMQKFGMYINGEFTDSDSGEFFDSFNPYTGKVWARVARGNAKDVDKAVGAAHRAFSCGLWPDMTASQRGRLLYRLGTIIERESKRLSEIEVRDNGKLLAEMQSQVEYVPQWYYYFGGLADKIQGSVIPLDKKGYFNFTRHEPLGVVAAITPWNSPLLLLSWKLAPALAAGCTVVIKPSEFTSASTLEFVRLVEEAGFPKGVVNVVTGLGTDVGYSLTNHELVKKIAFTGSDATGRSINKIAASSFKRVTLELGGKSPNIVFEDADLDDAVNGAVSGIFAATGQTCIAGSRLLLQKNIHDKFMERLVALAKTAKMGDPMSPKTQVGPITTLPQFDKVLKYIKVAKEEGAKLVLGGSVANRPECGQGWFIEPTVFTNVQNSMRIAQEEVFGPVLSVISFEDEEEAIGIANDIRFGLGSGVWTSDIGRSIRIAERIKAGTVWVNTYRAVSFMSPFGGYKDSGVGRESGIEAIYQYLQTKSVWINTGAKMGNPFIIK